MVFLAEQNKNYMFRPTSAIIRFSQLHNKLWKPDDGRYRPKHVVFVLFCYKYHHFSHIIVVFLTEIYPSSYGDCPHSICDT